MRKCASRCRGRIFGFSALLLLMTAAASLGQTTDNGEIRGTVQDAAGAPLARASVTVTNADTGKTLVVVSDAQGSYVVTSLPRGSYTISARSEAGAPATVVVATQTGVTATTQPQAANINSEASMIQTDKADLIKNSNTLRVLELPGRNSLSGLAGLENGVYPAAGSTETPKDRPDKTRQRSEFSVNGHRTTSNTYYVDGAYNTDPLTGTARQDLMPEPIQEFHMITSNYSADKGRNAGAHINVLTRSGTNDFHGILQYTWNHNSFDALSDSQENTFHSLRGAGLSEELAERMSRGTTKDDIASFQVGGPILPDNAFFFIEGDYDWFRSNAPPAPALAISPQGLANLRQFQGQLSPGALEFLTANFPAANDPTVRGQARIITPSGTAIPVPVQQFNRGFSDVIDYRADTWRLLPRFDIRWGTRDFLTARCIIDDYSTPGIPTSLPGFEADQDSRKQNLAVAHNHIFGTAGVNEARFSYGRIRDVYRRDDQLNLIVGGFNSAGEFLPNRDREDDSYQVEDVYTHILGSHTLRAGGSYLRYDFNGSFAPNAAGTLIYPTLTDLLLDRNAVFSGFNGTSFLDDGADQWNFFIQDDFKLTSRFTLNLGLRYQWQELPADFFGGAEADRNNFGPRFGFAWAPGGPGFFNRGVLRGGWGILYDQNVVWQVMPLISRNFPRGVTITEGPISGAGFFNPANRPLVPTPEQYLAEGGNPDKLGIVQVSPAGRVKLPYDQHFSLGWEQQFGEDWAFRAFYVGSRGLHRWRMIDRNPAFTPEAVAANPDFFEPLGLEEFRCGECFAFRPDGSRGSVFSIEPIGSSWYNSGQFSLDKRFSAGLQFTVNYTFSKYLNHADSITGFAPANPFNLDQDYAVSSLDQPHRLVTNWVYRIPELFDSGMLNRALGGWQLSGIHTWASGHPYTIFNSQNALGLVPGQIPGFLTTNQRAAIGDGGELFAPATSSGIVGNLGRNTQRLPRVFNFDMALVKDTRTVANQYIQFRWEVYNVFNRQRELGVLPFNTIGSDIEGRTLADLGDNLNPARAMLFTLRYMF